MVVAIKAFTVIVIVILLLELSLLLCRYKRYYGYNSYYFAIREIMTPRAIVDIIVFVLLSKLFLESRTAVFCSKIEA